MLNRTSLPWKELGEDFKKIYINQHEGVEATAQKAWEKLSPEEQRAMLNSVESKEEQKTYSQKDLVITSKQEPTGTVSTKDGVGMLGNLVKIIYGYADIGIFAKLPEGTVDSISETIFDDLKPHKLKKLKRLHTAILSGDQGSYDLAFMSSDIEAGIKNGTFNPEENTVYVKPGDSSLSYFSSKMEKSEIIQKTDLSNQNLSSFENLKKMKDEILAITLKRGHTHPDKAEEMIAEDPSLLLEKLDKNDFVTAPSKHKFNLKVYQAALAVGDPQIAKMIKAQLIKYFSEKEADDQYNEQCPKGWEAAEEKKWDPIAKQFDTLVLAIRDSKSGDIISSGDPHYIITVKKGSSVEEELLEFWRLLDATTDEVITAGKRPFNPNLLSKALELYDDDKSYKDYFGGRWNDPRALLFVQKVVGYEGIQRIMPVNDVQAFQDGLSNTEEKLKNDKPQGRSTRFEIYRSGQWEPVDFYPLQERGTFGFNFVVYGGGGRSRAMPWPGGLRVGGGCLGLDALSKLMSIKSSKLTELMPQHRDYRLEPTKSSCVIL